MNSTFPRFRGDIYDLGCLSARPFDRKKSNVKRKQGETVTVIELGRHDYNVHKIITMALVCVANRPDRHNGRKLKTQATGKLFLKTYTVITVLGTRLALREPLSDYYFQLETRKQ